MNEEQLIRSLNSIGKKSFVEDYGVYSNQGISRNEKVQILSNKYSVNGATIRVSYADTIFKHNKQNEALKIIIASPRMATSLKEQAKQLINYIVSL